MADVDGYLFLFDTKKRKTMKYLISKYLEKPFLLFPVNRTAEMVNVRILIEEKVYKEVTLRISKEAEMMADFCLEEFVGRKVEIEFFDESESLEHPELIKLIQNTATLLTETKKQIAVSSDRIRPKIHYTAAQGFMNDPNGLLYYKGNYHMFYQWNPYGVTSGNTSWGHCISKDCLHWEELEPAIVCDREDGCIFSGSGVVDEQNVSGLQEGEDAPILLFYTATGYLFPPLRYFRENFDDFFWESEKKYTRQCIAYSTDGGKSFRKYEGNPVLEQICPLNRDPKVVWNEEIKKWVMILFLSEHSYQLFFSENLLKWEKGQSIEVQESAECPDLFSLPVDGNLEKMKWVLWTAPENYQIGHFEDCTFVAESEVLCSGAGFAGGYASGYYAAQTFYGVPDHKVYQQFFIHTNFKGASFSSCMSLPLELSLVTVEGNMKLKSFPCKNVEGIRKNCQIFKNIEAPVKLQERNAREYFELELQAYMGEYGKFALSLRNMLFVYDRKEQMLLCPNGSFFLPVSENELHLHIWADSGSVELFTEDGLFHVTIAAILDISSQNIMITECKEALLSAKIWELEQIYPVP